MGIQVLPLWEAMPVLLRARPVVQEQIMAAPIERPIAEDQRSLSHVQHSVDLSGP
jgi:hypothetical protein